MVLSTNYQQQPKMQPKKPGPPSFTQIIWLLSTPSPFSWHSNCGNHIIDVHQTNISAWWNCWKWLAKKWEAMTEITPSIKLIPLTLFFLNKYYWILSTILFLFATNKSDQNPMRSGKHLLKINGVDLSTHRWHLWLNIFHLRRITNPPIPTIHHQDGSKEENIIRAAKVKQQGGGRSWREASEGEGQEEDGQIVGVVQKLDMY